MKKINTTLKALNKNELSKIVGGEVNGPPDQICLPSGPSASVPVPTPLPGGTIVDTSGTSTFQATSGDQAGVGSPQGPSLKKCSKTTLPNIL